MNQIEEFSFARAKGVVWVCDIVGSSKLINDDQAADAFEEFVPRLYLVSSKIVQAAGGHFVKWTGDGFLAWFETELHRKLGEISFSAIQAAWYLSFLINVTKLGIQCSKPFMIRNGISYEKDALKTNIKFINGDTDFDIMGRDVVLAFRLSGIKSQFPSISTQREVVEAFYKFTNKCFPIDFIKMNMSSEDKLRYFKGEQYGAQTVFITGHRETKVDFKTVLKKMDGAIKLAEGFGQPQFNDLGFPKRFLDSLQNGPDWCQSISKELISFVKQNILGTLKEFAINMNK